MYFNKRQNYAKKKKKQTLLYNNYRLGLFKYNGNDLVIITIPPHIEAINQNGSLLFISVVFIDALHASRLDPITDNNN